MARDLNGAWLAIGVAGAVAAAGAVMGRKGSRAAQEAPALSWNDVSAIKSLLDRRVPKSPDHIGSIGNGKAERYGNTDTKSGLYDLVTYDPQGRQRADHYGNDGEGWDTEGWDRDYAEPLRKWAQTRIDDAYGKGRYRAEVGEKGHLHITA